MSRLRRSASQGLFAAAALMCLASSAPSARSLPPRTIVVRLEGNAFRPDQIHASVGDTVRFVNGNGGPHNVAFEKDSIALAPRALLEKAMGGEKIGPLSSPLLLDPGETYAIFVPALPKGRYPLVCVPHLANMRGALIVSP